MDRYKPSTAGERLCQFVFKGLEDERTWRYLENAIRPLGDCVGMAAYYRHHAALFLTCKLISFGKSVTELDPGNMTLLSTAVEGFPWNRLNSGNRLLRFLADAVKYSNRPISPGTARDLLTYAKSRHPYCYICGMSLDFHDNKSRAYYTAEHLWPSAYGGDSTEDNLLPACMDCNGKKGSIATWVSTDVHALFLGMNPSGDRLKAIHFPQRYALYHRASYSLATAEGLSLKNAFLRLRHWVDATVYDSECPADMFNIKNHLEIEEFEKYERV
jgi:hypothetical protein